MEIKTYKNEITGETREMSSRVIAHLGRRYHEGKFYENGGWKPTASKVKTKVAKQIIKESERVDNG